MGTPLVKLLASERDWSCGTTGCAFLLCWRGPATVARARLVADALSSFSAAQRQIVLLTVVTPEATPPDTAARAVFAQGMRDVGPKVRGSAYFVPIDGFKGAAVRGAVTGISLLAREPFPTRVFARLTEASAWLSQRVESDLAAAAFGGELEAAVASLLTA